MKRIITWVLALVLITGMFTSTALASSMADLQGLRDYLEANLGKQNLFKEDPCSEIDQIFSLRFDCNYEYEFIMIFASSTIIDNEIKKCINTNGGELNALLPLFLNVGGAIARLSKQYGITDKLIVFIYNSDKEIVGEELKCKFAVCVDDDVIMITQDSMFILSTDFSLSQNFDSEFYFNESSLK